MTIKGTKAAAAAVAEEKVVEQQAQADAYISMALAPYELSDGGLDFNKLLADVTRAKGEEYAKKMELSIAQTLQAKLGPHGVIEMTVSTWDLGLKGKFHTAVTVLGYAAAASIVFEVVGYYMDWPSLRLITSATAFLHR